MLIVTYICTWNWLCYLQGYLHIGRVLSAHCDIHMYVELIVLPTGLLAHVESLFTHSSSSNFSTPSFSGITDSEARPKRRYTYDCSLEIQLTVQCSPNRQPATDDWEHHPRDQTSTPSVDSWTALWNSSHVHSLEEYSKPRGQRYRMHGHCGWFAHEEQPEYSDVWHICVIDCIIYRVTCTYVESYLLIVTHTCTWNCLCYLQGYLHSRDIIHRDLNSNNCLIKEVWITFISSWS